MLAASGPALRSPINNTGLWATGGQFLDEAGRAERLLLTYALQLELVSGLVMHGEQPAERRGDQDLDGDRGSPRPLLLRAFERAVKREDLAERPATCEALADVFRDPTRQVDDGELRTEQLDGLVEVRAARDLLQRDHVGAQVGQQPADDFVPLPAGRGIEREQVERQDAEAVGHANIMPRGELRSHQPELVGEDHRLDAVAQVELGEDAAHACGRMPYRRRSHPANVN